MKAVTRIISSLIFTMLASANSVTSALAQEVSIPDPGLNAAIREALPKPNGPLTAQDLLTLTNFVAISRNITNLEGLAFARNLTSLQLDDNHITAASFPDQFTNMTSLSLLNLSGNPLTNLRLPDALTNLTILHAEISGLTNLTLPAGPSKLVELHLGFNQLPTLALPAGMNQLNILSLFQNQLTNLTLPSNLTNLTQLDLDGNRFSSFNPPAGLTKLAALVVSDNQLTNFTVPTEMTNLTFLRLNNNQLTNLTLPPGLNHLSLMDLTGNQLAALNLPSGLTNLSFLNLNSNQLTNITLPVDMQQLIGLFFAGNPLVNFVLSEPLAASGLASTIDSLRNQGVNVFTYPLTPQLIRAQQLVGAFQFAIDGPPAAYSILSSTNLANWTVLGVITNNLGKIVFTDTTSHFSPQKFYSTLRQTAPTNMVFVPPNTFKFGSPITEPDREIFEGPQATVTLTHGFWIGKYEVTQGEYLAIMNDNPSDFPGDLSRPISSVTWSDATNYCGKLTQRELAAGRIPPGSRYRLPTEAEWECAARAGTTTRFSYGDDPTYGSLTNYAWFLDLGNVILTVRPVGQKLPNFWGLYDMYGNVWEWCQDWYGDQTGGVQIDPTGPASNPDGTKVIRGGAYDYPNSSCKSASRFFRFALFPDTDVGFRVVFDPGS